MFYIGYLCYYFNRRMIMNKKGFTLIELVVVIVLLGLLMTIAIPSSFKLANKVKVKAYDTKVKIIEDAAKAYGQNNLSIVRRGYSSLTNKNYSCTFNYDGNNISSVAMNITTYNESTVLKDNTYWCIKTTLKELADANSLSYDQTNKCLDCTLEEKVHYNNVITNPKSNYIMNYCNVYIYYKYNRVYSYFDEKSCAIENLTPNPTSGESYKPIKG